MRRQADGLATQEMAYKSHRNTEKSPPECILVIFKMYKGMERLLRASEHGMLSKKMRAWFPEHT